MIVLFTDFGLEGPYTGQVKAVLHRTAPGRSGHRSVCRCCPRETQAGGLSAGRIRRVVPAGTVLLAVVDPGVGSARAAVIVEADGRWYVGPDNGLFELVLRRAGSSPKLGDPRAPPEAMSASFHGRDLFAPAAGAARPRRNARRPRPARQASAGTPTGRTICREIVYIDRYGNAMTGLRAALLPTERASRRRRAACCGARGPSRTSRQGEAFWYENSNGLAEIAVNAGPRRRRSRPRRRHSGRDPRVTGRRSQGGGITILAPGGTLSWPAPLQPVKQPHRNGEDDKDDQHDEAERADQMAEHRAEGVAEEIADRDKACRPQPGGEEIQAQEALPMDRAHSHRK